MSGGPCHDCLLTYTSFCGSCKCFAAGRSDEGLLAELFTIGGWHTSLQFPVIAPGKGSNLAATRQTQPLCLPGDLSTAPNLESAFLATLMVPNGSLDFLSTMSCSRSSRKTTHLGIGCITVSKAFLSHEACINAHKFKVAHINYIWVSCLSSPYVPATSTKQCRMNFCVLFKFLPQCDTCAARYPERSCYMCKMTC